MDNLGVVRIQDDCLYSAYGGACQLTSGDCDYRSIGCEGNYGASEFLIKNGTNVQMFSRDNGFACSDGEIFQNRAGAIGGLCAEDNSFVVNDSTGEPVFCIKSDNGTWYAKSAIYASVVVS